MNATDILIDAASRPLEALEGQREALTSADLNAHPGGHDNSLAWLLWHIGREIDVQAASLSGREEVWTASGHRDALDLGELGDEIGYGFSAEQAREIRSENAQALLAYIAEATGALIEHIRTLSEEDLDEVIDESYDPPVTRGARLVSIIDDASQHAGQVGYALGLAEG